MNIVLPCPRLHCHLCRFNEINFTIRYSLLYIVQSIQISSDFDILSQISLSFPIMHGKKKRKKKKERKEKVVAFMRDNKPYIITFFKKKKESKIFKCEILKGGWKEREGYLFSSNPQ